MEKSNKKLEDEILYLKKKVYDLEERNEEIKLDLSNIRLSDLKFQALNCNIMKKFSKYIDNLKNNYVRFSHINALKKEFSNMNKFYKEILSIYNLFGVSVKFIDDWNFYEYLINNIDEFNEEYVKHEIEINKDYFSNINNALNENERISLDDDQRYSLVVDDDNNLIIAGAGSGKTLTIVSKIKYLIEKKHINPNEIFVFSFLKESVKDIKKKIKKLNIVNYNDHNVSTFHKKGINILKNDSKIPFNVAEDWELGKVIDDYFFKVMHNQDIAKKIIEFFAKILPMNLPPPNSLAELAELQRNNDFETIKSKYKNNIKETLKGEKVKSVEELLIANFLFLNGVEYEYERTYDPLEVFNSHWFEFKNPIDLDKDLLSDFSYCGLTSIRAYLYIKALYDDLKDEWNNEENWVKYYRPDFFLPKYNIYLEHFGIDENGKVRWLPEFSGEREKYVKRMDDKRKIHEKYKTKLLETYSYFRDDLLEKLEEILISNGIKFREINYSNLYKCLIEKDNLNSDFQEIKKLISSFINLFKGNGFKEEKFLEFKIQNNEEESYGLKKKNEFLLDIIHWIYLNYQEHLSSNNKIDFNDMINNASEIIKRKGTDEKHSYLIIDEFQDISFTRKELIKAIQEKNDASVTVVGDDWQSIYRFAGSQLSLFTDFEKDFSNHRKRPIRNNYRNPQNLINLATKFIEKNPDQIKKNIISKKEKNISKPVKFYYLPEKQQSITVLKRMIEDILKEFPYGSITILGRNKHDLKSLFFDDELFYDLNDIYEECKNKMYVNPLVNDIFALLNKYENRINDHHLFTDINFTLEKYEKIVNNQINKDLMKLLDKYEDKIVDNQLFANISSIMGKYEESYILVNDLNKLLRKYEFYDNQLILMKKRRNYSIKLKIIISFILIFLQFIALKVLNMIMLF